MRIGLEMKCRGVTSDVKFVYIQNINSYDKILQENKKRARIIPIDFQWSVKKDVNTVNIKKFQPLDFQWRQNRCLEIVV